MDKEDILQMPDSSPDNNLKAVSNEGQSHQSHDATDASLNVREEDAITEKLLDELADIFVESILYELEHGKLHEKGSDILPGINKRTG